MEWVLRTQQLGDAADKCKPFARQKRSGTLLTVEPGQIGLVIEKLQLAGRARHMQVNNPLGAAGKLRRQDGERMRRVAGELEPRTAVDAAFGRSHRRDKGRTQCAQKHGAHARSETTQKVTASLRLQQREAFFPVQGSRRYRRRMFGCTVCRIRHDDHLTSAASRLNRTLPTAVSASSSPSETLLP